jgi:hypothetical protein
LADKSFRSCHPSLGVLAFGARFRNPRWHAIRILLNPKAAAFATPFAKARCLFAIGTRDEL